MPDLPAYAMKSGPRELGPETLHYSFGIRRGHERAYRRWMEMLHGRACPSIDDVDPASVAGPGDMLIDLRHDCDDPRLVCVGGALIQDCGKKGMKRVSDVPSVSFLSLLAAHYWHVAASGGPIAFEGERQGPGGPTTYRGILLPLSSDGRTVDFIHGSISWREPADDMLAARIERDLGSLRAPGAAPTLSLWPAA